jgi:predicted alpha/beta-fold hydrolase
MHFADQRRLETVASRAREPQRSARFGLARGPAALALVLTGCLQTHLVELSRVDLTLPPQDPRAGWQADVDTLLKLYETAPVLAPEDERLEPLFGALTTLSYFGADAAARVLDQQIPPHARALGQSLRASCVAGSRDPADVVLATSGLPAFSPVWIPLAVRGGSARESARCDDHGRPSDDESFCAFGRVALQPAPGAHPLVVVVHGLFDSGAQDYVQRTAAVLYRLGYAVLLPDMRDHGDTLRAAPEIATTLGTLEGADLLALVDATRAACGDRIGRVGILGVSGGGLDAVRAFTLDRRGSLDAGVIALSPLLDVNGIINDLAQTGACPITGAVELSWLDDVMLAGASGVAAFGGAALAQGLAGQPIDGNTALAGGIGAGVGLLTALAVDAWFDGGTQPCVAQHAMAQIVENALQVRWHALRAPELGSTMSASGRRIAPEAIDIEGYVRERAQFLAARSGVQLRRFDARSLSRELRSALAPGTRTGARLLVIGAEDDPLTRQAPLNEFVRLSGGIPQVYARAVRHGGHGAMWVVQPAVMRRMVADFFAPQAGGALP